MALDFGVLRNIDPVSAFYKGQEDVAQNALARQQAAQTQEVNALRRQEAELGLQRSRNLLASEQEQTVNAKRAEKTAMFRDRLLRARTPADARTIVTQQYADPDVGSYLSQFAPVEQALSEVPDDPNQFQTYVQQEAMGMTEWLKSQMPKVVGGSIYKPATGEFVTPQKQSSKLVPILVGGQPVLVPEEQAVGQIPANAQTMRGLGGGRASAGGGTSATGRAPSGYRFTPTGELEPIPGGPAASKAEGGESFLTRKEMEKREASLPKATQSVKIVGNTMSTIEETVDRLLNNAEGLNGITGLIYGRTPGVTDASRQAEADLNQLKNLAFVQGLTELREASKTGAGVGNVSNKEGERFENLKASLDRTQSRESLSQALLRLKAQAQFTKQSLQDAFDDTYQYRSGQSTNVPVVPTGAKPIAKSTAPNIDALLEKYK